MSFPIYVKTNLWIAKLISETEAISIFLETSAPKINNISRESEHTYEYRAYLAGATTPSDETEWSIHHRLACDIYINAAGITAPEPIIITTWNAGFETNALSSGDFMVCAGEVQATYQSVLKTYRCILYCNRWGGIIFMQLNDISTGDVLNACGYLHINDESHIFSSKPAGQDPSFGTLTQNTIFETDELPLSTAQNEIDFFS